MQITSGRIRLRRLCRDDVDFILAVTSDPQWMKYIGDRGVSDSTHASQYINTTTDSFSSSGYGLWLVESGAVSGDNKIGLCGFIQRPFLSCPDLGYAFLPHGRGQGLATEAVRLALDWGQQHLTSACVSAICRTDNTASLNLLERVGFSRIGQFYQSEQPVHYLFLKSFSK